MQDRIEIVAFIEQCSDIKLDRDAAIAEESPYRVYLDISSGYPQVKIIAQAAKEYDAMDHLLEEPSPLSGLSGGQNYFAIHDNYSFYASYNDFTYTIPLTHANFAVLQHLFSHKAGFKPIEDCYQDLVDHLPERFSKARDTSKSYKVYEMMLDYGNFKGGPHLYTQTTESNATHIEQLRGWQATLLSDSLSAVFVKDNGNPILNDIVAPQLDEDMIDSYFARYNWETDRLQQAQKKQDLIHKLASEESVLLCGILAATLTNNIFLPYSLTAHQCQNETYKLQTSNETFITRLKADPELATLYLPSQAELVSSLYSNNRWCIDGSADSQGSADPSHLAWQCGVYYQPIDTSLRDTLNGIGLERLADPSLNNTLVCLPYQYFKLLVLCINIQKNPDLDFKQIILERCLTYLDNLLKTGTVLAIPEAIIQEIGKQHGPGDERIRDYRKINQLYYQEKVYPSLLRDLLDVTKAMISGCKDDHLGGHGSLFAGFDTLILNAETQAFEEVHFSSHGDEKLIEAVLTLTDPSEFTLQFVRQFKENELPLGSSESKLIPEALSY